MHFAHDNSSFTFLLFAWKSADEYASFSGDGFNVFQKPHQHFCLGRMILDLDSIYCHCTEYRYTGTNMYSLHLTHPSLLRSSGLQWCARGATGGSVPCSWTLRLATNGECRDRIDDLGVAGRPPHPTELQPPTTHNTRVWTPVRITG